jgi:hypothetical protein
MQISFNLSDDLLGKIDTASAKENLSRSRFIVKCINAYLTSDETHSYTRRLQNEVTEAEVNESRVMMIGDSAKQAVGKYEHLKAINSGKEATTNGFFSLKEVMSAKDQMISDKEIIIDELKIQNEFLRSEYKKLSDRLCRAPPSEF